MSTATTRDLTRRSGASADQRLTRLLDSTALARVVPQLAAETLHQLIHHRGLEACGEVLVSATPAQLTALADLDLWRQPSPGRDEQFDVERFGAWLEVLADTGDSAAARTLAALDTHVVVTGLSRFIRVFDPGIFEPTESTDDEALERGDLMHSETTRDVVECEVGGYLVRARRTEAWDAIVALLVTLEVEHHASFHLLMQGCRGLSNSLPEIDGLHELLTTSEQHLHDEAAERERRRSRRGYATAADARAFLQMTRHGPRAADATGRTTHPIAVAYFRAAVDVDEDDATSGGSAEVPTDLDPLIALLAEAGVTPARPQARLGHAAGDAETPRLVQLTRLMEFAQRCDGAAHLTRSRELAFLANTLLAGCGIQARTFTPEEASEAAASVCNLALDSWTAPLPDTYLVDHDLVSVFEMGWSQLHRDVGLHAMDHLIAAVAGFRGIDVETGVELRRMQRTLATHRDAGTPWLARDAVDVLAALDPTVWVAVLGLLDECPHLPEALTAVLEHRSTPVSPTTFRFISTAADVDHVRAFLRALHGVCSS